MEQFQDIVIRKFWHFQQMFLSLTAARRCFTLEPMVVCTDTAPPDFFVRNQIPNIFLFNNFKKKKRYFPRKPFQVFVWPKNSEIYKQICKLQPLGLVPKLHINWDTISEPINFPIRGAHIILKIDISLAKTRFLPYRLILIIAMLEQTSTKTLPTLIKSWLLNRHRFRLDLRFLWPITTQPLEIHAYTPAAITIICTERILRHSLPWDPISGLLTNRMFLITTISNQTSSPPPVRTAVNLILHLYRLKRSECPPINKWFHQAISWTLWWFQVILHPTLVTPPIPPLIATSEVI